MIHFDGVDAYLVGSGSICVMFVHDLFGLPSGMNKLLCDTLSEKLPNVTIIAPDFFPLGKLCGDDPLPQRGSAMRWKLIWPLCSCQLFSFIGKYSWENSSREIFNTVTRHMISNYKCEKFFILGFCWGAYISYTACGDAEHKDLIIGKLEHFFVVLSSAVIRKIK